VTFIILEQKMYREFLFVVLWGFVSILSSRERILCANKDWDSPWTDLLKELNFVLSFTVFQFTQQKILDTSLMQAVHKSAMSGEDKN